ncbi:Uncharacterised protein [Vibrio cholerae]|nr:Uncharacterised protein [Vibrio cholerae]
MRLLSILEPSLIFLSSLIVFRPKSYVSLT